MTTKPGRFWTRSVEIDALQYTGDNAEDVIGWINLMSGDGCHAVARDDRDRLLINTPKGVLIAWPGDWALRGVTGQIDVCDAPLFAATTEPVPTDFFV